MALTAGTMIPELWSARLIRAFDQVNVYTGLFTDVSSEITDGDTVNYSGLTTEVTVGDYTRYTDIAAPQNPDDTDYSLEMDTAKYFNINVDDLDQVQARPAVMDEFVRKAAVAVANEVNNDYRTAWMTNLPSGKTESIKAVTDNNTRRAFIEAVVDANNELKKANVPMDGRFMVIGPDLESELIKHIIRDGEQPIGTGSLADNAFTTGMLSNFLGIRTVVDTTFPAVAAGKPMAVIDRADGTYHARQVAKVESYRPEKRFADAVKGLYLYGIKVIRRDSMRVINQST